MIESLEGLRDRLRVFAKERDWDQFHTPKNLSMALIAEAAELIEHFQWVDGDTSHLLEGKTRQSVEEELADILIYLVRITEAFAYLFESWTLCSSNNTSRFQLHFIQLFELVDLNTTLRKTSNNI